MIYAQEGILAGVKNHMLLASLSDAIAWAINRRPGMLASVMLIKAFTYAIAMSPLASNLYASRAWEWDNLSTTLILQRHFADTSDDWLPWFECPAHVLVQIMWASTSCRSVTANTLCM